MTITRVFSEMTTNTAKVQCGTSLVEVVAILTAHQLNAAPVVNGDDQVIGLVAESDCMQALISGSYYCDKPALVNDVMTKTAVVIAPQDSIIDVAIRMAADKFSVYPVVDNDKLVGVLSRRNILRVLAQQLNQCGD